MRKNWIRFGCFLTGYNYKILEGCSENSTRRVLRYTSAILIPCFLWAFVGFFFASRYLKLDWYYALLGAFAMMVMVIQIERQVILSSRCNRAPFYFRIIIAIAMAVIGSIIIDQILFKDDIEQQKLIMMDEKVRKILPGRAEELKRQIGAIDSTISSKEQERKELLSDISKNPTITIYARQVVRQSVDTTTSEVTTRSSSQIQNPKMALLQPMDDQIANLRIEKLKKDSMLLVLRPVVEAELKQNVGFLDEMKLMYSILRESNIAFGVWLLWFVFLLGIEGFILISKWKEGEVDYDEVINQQMKLHYKRLELLSKQ